MPYVVRKLRGCLAAGSPGRRVQPREGAASMKATTLTPFHHGAPVGTATGEAAGPPGDDGITAEDLAATRPPSAPGPDSRFPSAVLVWEGRAYTVSIEVVDPGLAEAYRDSSVGNRELKEKAIEGKYVPDLREGRWVLNGEPFIFDADGHLRDGHNRSEAVIRSGATMTTFVIRGVGERAVTTMDTGNARTFGDHRAITGRGGSNSTRIAPIAKAVMHAARNPGGELMPQRAPAVSNIALDDFLAENPALEAEIEEAAHFLASTFTLRPGDGTCVRMSSAAYGLVYILGRRMNPDVTREFFTRIAHAWGEDWGHTLSDPERAVRVRLQKAYANRERLPDWDILYMLLRTWNARMEGKPYTKSQLAKGTVLPKMAPAAADPYGRLALAAGGS
jgi:hypothetical protein